MYCTNCGKELSGGEFCTNCGQRVGSPINNQNPNLNVPVNRPVPKTASNNKNRTILLSVVGGAALLLVVILVFSHGKHRDNNTIPYNNDPYNYSQDFNAPSSDYSNGYSGYDTYDSYNTYDSDDTYDSYDYGNNKQICPSCFGSGTCPICDGTGQYSMYGSDYSTCTACGGTGVCSICGGTGFC